MLRHLGTLIVLAALAGCQTEKKAISIREIVDDVESYSSILDVKIEKYEQLIREYPTEPKHRERLAAFYWHKEDHKKALEHLAAAKELEPKNTKFDFMEGQIYQGTGNYALAEACYRRILDKLGDDEFTGPHYDLAWLYLELNRTEDAEKQLTRCIEIDPDDPLPWYHLGKLAFDEKQDRELTIKYFEKYMELGGWRHHEEVRRTLIALQPELGRQRYTGD